MALHKSIYEIQIYLYQVAKLALLKIMNLENGKIIEAWIGHQKHRDYFWNVINIHNNIMKFCDNIKNITNICDNIAKIWNNIVNNCDVTKFHDNIAIIRNKYVTNICDNGVILSVERVYVLTMSKPVYHFYWSYPPHYVIFTDHVHPLYHVYKQLLIEKSVGLYITLSTLYYIDII